MPWNVDLICSATGWRYFVTTNRLFLVWQRAGVCVYTNQLAKPDLTDCTWWVPPHHELSLGALLSVKYLTNFESLMLIDGKLTSEERKI